MILGVCAVSALAKGGKDDEVRSAFGAVSGRANVTDVHRQDARQAASLSFSHNQDGERGRHDNRERGHERGWGHDDHGHGRHATCCGGGYWQIVERKVWMPATFGVEINSCGTRIRFREPGYWTFVRERVWVSGHAQVCRYR